MTRAVELQKDIYWLGVLDKDLRVFDIIMETTYGTTYNAYLVKTSAGSVLVETVKEKFFDSYIRELKGLLGDLSSIKYLISNHTEPDHAGSIMKLLRLLPDIEIVASRTALGYLKEITNTQFRSKAAEDIETLTVGERTFEFISAPMLHWPDSMYSYLRKEQVLFTCDSFGSHYSPLRDIRISHLGPDEETGYQDALLYYYTAIFGPFKSYVIKACDKIDKLDVKMICVGHGPVLDARIEEIVGRYRTWSTVEPKKGPKKVVMAYCSAYGYTGEMADAIKEGITAMDPSIEISCFNVHIGNYGELKPSLVGAIAEADGVLLGTCTINGDALPFVWDLALSMNPITHGGKVVSAFGAYGWSGEGVDNIMDRLKQLRLKVIEGLKIKFRPSETQLELCRDFGKKFGDAVKTGEVPPLPKQKQETAVDYEALNPTGKICLWRCTICGEIVPGVVPPAVCAACGVGQEMFELYEPEEVKFSSATEETFIIIGTSAAGVAAVDAIRCRAPKAKIILIGKEELLPYYRPNLSTGLTRELSDEEFYLHPAKWYTDNKVDLKLGFEVIEVSTGAKTVTLDSKEVLKYDKLIFCNGSSSFVPNLPGRDLDGVFSLRYKADADKIQQWAKGKKHAVCIGGGVLGLEAAAELRKMGLEVTVIEFVARVMPRQLEVGASAFLLKAVQNAGVKMKCGAAAKSIRGEGGVVQAVVLGDGEIPADMVILSLGVRSNTKLAENAGIRCGKGIVVNEKMETSAPGVYAAGDVTEFGRAVVQLWAPALAQGRVAGANAVGDEAIFKRQLEPVSLVAFGTEMFAIGDPPADELGTHSLADQDVKTGQYMKLMFKDDRMIYGVTFLNSLKFQTVQSGVRNGHPFSSVAAALY
jgi:flavorubredoxin/NADPH-dependent 2,4-dienoyl-CoA reductase/sulfur reductase-like enzyme